MKNHNQDEYNSFHFNRKNLFNIDDHASLQNLNNRCDIELSQIDQPLDLTIQDLKNTDSFQNASKISLRIKNESLSQQDKLFPKVALKIEDNQSNNINNNFQEIRQTANSQKFRNSSIALFQIKILDSNQTWINTQDLINAQWIDVYIHGVYWAVSTMVTILYALNIIGIIIKDINKEQNQVKEERKQLNQFFHRRQITSDLRERIYDQDSKQNIQQIIIEEQFSANEKIKSPENDDISLYVVAKGQAQIYIPSYDNNDNDKDISICNLNENDVFGIFSFFSGQYNNKEHIKSVGSSVILRISRSKLINILKQNRKDYEIFREITDLFYQGGIIQFYLCKHIKKIIIIQSTHLFSKFLLDEKGFIKQKCRLCGQFGHQLKYCDKCHLIINRKQLIYDYQNFNTQLRNIGYKRQNIRTQNAKQNQKMIEITVFNLEEIIDQNQNEEFQKCYIELQELYDVQNYIIAQNVQNISTYQSKMQNQQQKFQNQFDSYIQDKNYSKELSYQQLFLNGGFKRQTLNNIDTQQVDKNFLQNQGNKEQKISCNNNGKTLYFNYANNLDKQSTIGGKFYQQDSIIQNIPAQNSKQPRHINSVLNNFGNMNNSKQNGSILVLKNVQNNLNQSYNYNNSISQQYNEKNQNLNIPSSKQNLENMNNSSVQFQLEQDIYGHQEINLIFEKQIDDNLNNNLNKYNKSQTLGGKNLQINEENFKDKFKDQCDDMQEVTSKYYNSPDQSLNHFYSNFQNQKQGVSNYQKNSIYQQQRQKSNYMQNYNFNSNYSKKSLVKLNTNQTNLASPNQNVKNNIQLSNIQLQLSNKNALAVYEQQFKKNDWDLLNFDKPQNYQFYLVHNNMNQIISYNQEYQETIENSSYQTPSDKLTQAMNLKKSILQNKTLYQQSMYKKKNTNNNFRSKYKNQLSQHPTMSQYMKDNNLRSPQNNQQYISNNERSQNLQIQSFTQANDQYNYEQKIKQLNFQTGIGQEKNSQKYEDTQESKKNPKKVKINSHKSINSRNEKFNNKEQGVLNKDGKYNYNNKI
ncbi:Cyclic nucleotide-binding protein [Pseudocohnilembus persalinus]|uniref:Cyclic nucleotide-binding protein n=1 Tax=Pseudocohnilembus persalinus TaxID=266149 RepID=A0A0V0QR81_PSEPJ|nr:Cyclic nucleotide-binding protein [Pseudocohnilembus persalinus]|eukprot:KRX04520.1 Cyclic nucleotide-binding protein [Pseudocohnilembus persalinus]